MSLALKAAPYLLCALGIGLIGSVLADEVAPLVSLAEKNKQADMAYLAWRLDSPESKVSPQLRSLLGEAARTFIVNESQLPFDRFVSKQELHEKVRTVTSSFIQRFNPPSSVNKFHLEELVGAVILPEYLLQFEPTMNGDTDKTYNDFMRTLELYKTPAGTFLYTWALRFLTSEAQIIALSVIERYTSQGEHFNSLTPAEKQNILESVSGIVAERFMINLGPVRTEAEFEVPPFLSTAVKDRVNLFLRKKFIN